MSNACAASDREILLNFERFALLSIEWPTLFFRDRIERDGERASSPLFFVEHRVPTCGPTARSVVPATQSCRILGAMSFWRNRSGFRLARPTTLIILGAAVSSAALLECVGDDPTTAPIADAGTDSLADGNDLDTGPSSCAWDAPFNAPVQLAGIPTDAIEGHPSLSPNELTIYFHGFGGSLSDSGNDNLFVATRSSQTDPFGAPSKLPISTNGPDENASVSSDGTTLYYDSTAPDAGASAMWVAQKNSSAVFGSQHPLGSPPASPQAGITVSDGQPFITADNAELWFTSKGDAGTGAVNIFSSLLSGGLFALPTEQAMLNSSASDYAPLLSFDRLTVYFASARPGGGGGMDDIWRSHRSTVTDAFPMPSPVTELNSSSDEFGGWLSADNCRIHFESKRNDNLNHIFIATRSP